MMRHRKRGPTAGFSLVEVNLAVLLVGLGMLVVFGLFPAGLREGENAESDTQSALFADFVFSGLRAKAGTMTWDQWTDLNEFKLVAADSVPFGPIEHTGGAVRTGNTAVSFPPGSETYISYIMDVSGDSSNRLRAVALWATSGKFAATVPATFKRHAKWYYTRCYYTGMNE